MSASQRNKGASAERALFRLLSDELGTAVERNLSQTRGGGADCLSIDGLAIEVKRQEKGFQESWWQQATQQAGSDRVPVVAYRRSRQPWSFCVPIGWIERTQWQPDALGRYRATVDLQTFCYLVRERLGPSMAEAD